MSKNDDLDFYGFYRAGQQELSKKNFGEAYEMFEKAHYLGIFQTLTHVQAHWGKFLVLRGQRKFQKEMLELFFLVMAIFTPFTKLSHRIGLFLPMHPVTKQAFDREYQLAVTEYQVGNFDQALHHLGRAHILGSHFAFSHFVTHSLMLKIELRRVNFHGILVQSMRTVGALFTRLLVHRSGVTGNPGYSSFPIGARLPVASDLRPALDKSLHKSRG